MNAMSMASPWSATTALLMVATMVAMMLPSVAPSVWRYRCGLRAVRVSHPGGLTTLFAAGYASVWTAASLLLFAMNAMTAAVGISPRVSGAIILCASILQCSRWKANQLVRCREACAVARPVSIPRALRDGCELGVDCCLSCAAPMAVLFATGLMDTRVMTLIAAAITAERSMTSGARIARLTGAVALVAGFVMCVPLRG